MIAQLTSTPQAILSSTSSHKRRDTIQIRGESNERHYGGGDGEKPPPQVTLEKSHIINSSKSNSSS